MFSRFFIERPIFANVMGIIIVIIGLISAYRLPISQFPDITPPTIQVTTLFPGASAETLVDSVARPIEEAVNGVEKMIYMKSYSTSRGEYALTVTFEIGTDIDMAQILVENRVSTAVPLLPIEVQRQGVTTKKVATDILLVVTLTSPEGRYDDLYMNNYALINLKEELARIKGVGDVRIFGVGSYAMRIWLDPHILQSLQLTPSDVVQAIQGQNIEVPAGEIGSPPASSRQSFQYNIRVKGRLDKVEDFENIIVKSRTEEAGQIVRVKDVGRVELGAQTYNQFNEKAGLPSAGIGIFLSPGANALGVATEVDRTMKRLSKYFPPGLQYSIPFNITQFVRSSINEVYLTFIEAIILVLLVIMFFLQMFRAVIIPGTAIPVTIIGAFIAMQVLGYTINMITMFALVLAIGIVVDDGIIIVEGVSYHMEQGLSPKEATVEAMKELSSPIYGITAVLMAVFIPAVFLAGVTGQLYKQFSLVIAATALISAFNALTLQPAQCVLYLKPKKEGRQRFFLFRWFNAGYARSEAAYLRIIGWMVRHTVWSAIFYIILIAFAVWVYFSLPKGFFPTEDQGYVMVGTELPDAASLERTHEVAGRMNKIIKKVPGIKDWVTVGGISLLENFEPKPNAAVTFVILEPWSKRGSKLNVENIRARLQRELSGIREAVFIVALPPAIRGVGTVSGFEMEVQLKSGSLDFDQLEKGVRQIIKEGSATPGIIGVATPFNSNVPQVFADVDRVKSEALEVPVADVFNTLDAYMGSVFVNQFNRFGRTFQVYVQADTPYRMEPGDIHNLYVRSAKQEMVPLGSLVDLSFINGPSFITLYNLYPSAAIIGSTTAALSSGQSLTIMADIARQTLPANMGFAWTGMSYQENVVGHQIIFIFAISVLLVYLVLAALYESWADPASVILAVPLAVLGIAVAVALRGYNNNIFTEIGVVLLIALASKNAILIVDYARSARAAGESIVDAAVTASRRRLRPILMTSLAFVFGVIPLFVATGAGAAGRRDIGTAVIGGMLASTLLAMLFVPVFFVVFQGISEWWGSRKKQDGSPKQALAKSEKPKTPKSVPTKKAPAAKKPAKPTATDQVVKIVKASRKGVDVATLVEKTGFSAKTIRSILSKACKKGRIKRIGRGIYAGKKAASRKPDDGGSE
jgi:HAE1 family hydrophobic/amphiphilic exporter-1